MIRRTLDAIIRYALDMPAVIYLLIMTGVGFIARNIYLTKASIWHDEGYTTMIINLPPSDIIATTANDVHPPLYYLLLHYWQVLFGSSEAALRGFSVACGLATIIVLYFLLRKLFSEKTARLAVVFTSLAPFLVRYSEEARPYALAALIAVIATYLFVLALERKKYWLWGLYGLAIAAGLYTQYYLALLVPAHVVYAWFAMGASKASFLKLLRLPGLWFGGIICIAFFSPWLPSLIAQVTRVNSGFWIPPVDWHTIPNALSSFMAYSHTTNILASFIGYDLASSLGSIEIILAVLFVWYAIRLAGKQPSKRAAIWLLLSWCLLPMLIIVLLSLKRPVFMDRYFVFVAPAFYALLAVYIAETKFSPRKWWANTALTLATFAVLITGIGAVGAAATHQMGTIGGVVTNNYRPGDVIVSAELYTFFDFSYYNHTGAPVKLLSANEFGAYGEWSLLKGREHLRVAHLHDIQASRVWLVGKTGEHDYYETDTPSTWRLINTWQAGDSAVRLYEIAQ